jgi:DNA-binding response OmpR family regulator
MDGRRAAKLLLVEDERLLRELIAQFLSAERFEVVEAADGSEAIELFSDQGPFDLVLLDLNLPRICGVEVCRRIKSLHPAQPIIICSAAILDSHLAALEEMHVEQFLSKPYHPLELLSRIAEELSRRGPVEPTGEPSAPGAEPAGRRVRWGAHTLVKTPRPD